MAVVAARTGMSETHSRVVVPPGLTLQQVPELELLLPGSIPWIYVSNREGKGDVSEGSGILCCSLIPLYMPLL